MKKYKCHKEVDAEPMTATEYFTSKNREVPEKFLGTNGLGYRVVYSKGTEDEYVSWSPAKQFEEGYTEIK